MPVTNVILGLFLANENNKPNTCLLALLEEFTCYFPLQGSTTNGGSIVSTHSCKIELSHIDLDATFHTVQRLRLAMSTSDSQKVYLFAASIPNLFDCQLNLG